MLKGIYINLLIVGYYLGVSQNSNLIKNSSFEKHAIQIDCNGGFDVAGVPTNYHIVDNWYTFNSPDYFNAICSVGWYNVPFSRFGNAFSKHGNAYAGAYLYKKTSPNDIKEYVYQNLAAPLKQDSIYCLSFFSTRAGRTPFSIKTLGAYFSINIPTTTATGYISATPQVVNTSIFLTDTVNWIEVQGCFTAQGGEQYITIGNFNSNANTDTLRIQSTNPLTGTGTDVAYYYIDSVSLWKNNFPTTIKEFSKDDGFLLYPNPTEGKLKLISQHLKEKESCMIKITDMLGREVKQLNFEEEIDITDLENGIYFVAILQNGKTLGVKKIIKQ